MARQLSTQSAFLICRPDPEPGVCGSKSYCVTLSGLRNDVNGNRRYEAIVVDLDDLSQDDRSSGAFRYRFTGHCSSEREEAEFALGLYLESR